MKVRLSKQLMAFGCVLVAAGFVMTTPRTSIAASKSEMEAEARTALQELYKSTPGAKELGQNAKAVLVFPSVTKGGFVVAGQYGEGVLFKGESAVGFYNTAAASVGLQAGIEKYGYALFFMTDDDLKYLDRSEGWELGVGPSLTVVDKGMAAQLSTTTARKGVYAFAFDPKGLMGGLGLQGTKITKMTPKA